MWLGQAMTDEHAAHIHVVDAPRGAACYHPHSGVLRGCGPAGVGWHYLARHSSSYSAHSGRRRGRARDASVLTRPSLTAPRTVSSKEKGEGRREKGAHHYAISSQYALLALVLSLRLGIGGGPLGAAPTALLRVPLAARRWIRWGTRRLAPVLRRFGAALRSAHRAGLRGSWVAGCAAQYRGPPRRPERVIAPRSGRYDQYPGVESEPALCADPCGAGADLLEPWIGSQSRSAHRHGGIRLRARLS